LARSAAASSLPLRASVCQLECTSVHTSRKALSSASAAEEDESEEAEAEGPAAAAAEDREAS